MSTRQPEVYSLDEIARAAYVDRPAVEALVARGRLPVVPGTTFVAEADAVRAARVLRHSALLASAPADNDLFAPAAAARAVPRPSAWSLGIHLSVLALALAVGRSATPAASTSPESPSHLVFLVEPGPGGGGGGGGARVKRPATRRLERAKAPPVQTPSTPAPTPPPAPAQQPEPIPAKPIIAPVAHIAAALETRDGAIDGHDAAVPSPGPGSDGPAGTGRDGGNGPGRGPGIGDGQGGGAGGGPYRPGSGVEPPRLIREVKGVYSEEARRANITGDVLMEVVVRADGSVGSARVTRGLGHGLDEAAVAAVKQWRFTPARRAGVAVDVAVEVAMEFNLR